ncbi:MAG: Sec-independent protein translocase subunit TatB [Campylobacterales bacterium]|nr:Sec-independent protein translocase subunit TatB [Campylobacterales bacterium]HEO98774.1 Sec-independent protein translocase subunit TatB [Campylobacterota bacterium]
MFGIGFTELVLIAIIAILFLGPDKLPQAMVDIAKFIKSIKQTVGEAKSSLEEEIKIADLKEEAMNYKKQLTEVSDELRGFKNLSLEDLDDDFAPREVSSDMTAAQKHRQQIEAEAKNTAPEHNEKIATQVEPKQEYSEIKTKKPDPYAQPDRTPKGSVAEEKEKKSGDA